MPRLHVVLLLFILCAIIGCDKEDDPISLPTLVTDNVQMSSLVATFSGSISNIKGKVEEYGFVWGDVDTPNKTFSVNIGETTTNISFQHSINNTFTEGSTYFVKTYVSINGTKHFGNTISFTRITPFFSDFSPQVGFAGTAVTLQGKNFIPGETVVMFEGIEAELVSNTANQIVALVPEGLPAGNISVSIRLKGETITAPNYFLSKVISITDFSPTQGTYGEVITINGTGFNTITDWYGVSMGGQYATWFDKSDTQMKIIVPSSLFAESAHITIQNWNESVVSAEIFYFLPPQFDFSPKTGKFGDEILITGKNFHPDTYQNHVYMNGVEVYVQEATATTLKIVVPEDFSSDNGKAIMGIKVGPFTSYSTDEFELTAHSITSVSLTNARRGDEIIITGENFNPNTGFNEVFVGSLKANVLESSTTQIRFTLPVSVSEGDFELKVRVGGRDVVFSQLISVIDPWTRKSDIPGQARYGGIAFAIGGRGYVGGGVSVNGDLLYDFYEYDPGSDSWERKADMPWSGQGMTSFSTTTKGYALYKKNLVQYDPDADQWIAKAEFPGDGFYYQSAFAIGDRAFAGTGTNEWGYRLSEFYEYDEVANQWSARANYYQEADNGVGFAANGKGYFTFGMWIHRDIYEYTLSENNWAYKRELSSKVVGLNYMRVNALAISAGTKAYFGTGSNDGSVWAEFYSDLYEFDPVANTCTRLTDMPNVGRINAVGFSVGGKLYVGSGLGNFNENGQAPLNDFYVYDSSKE